jgi:hypothetical protein
MTILEVLALVALLAAVVLLGVVRGQHRAGRRITAGDSSYVYVDGGYVYVGGGADSGCSPGSDGGGCDGGGGGD